MARKSRFARGLNRRFRFVENDVLYVIRLLVAFILIVVGLIGLLFPIVPDWPLLIIGIVILDVRGGMRRWIIRHLPHGWREKAHKILFNKFFRRFEGGVQNNG